ncbi:MAG: ABC transporter permease [Acidobacteria bacterium]|nr:ABC transporter permease [Acidobacteriota bacterium]
MNPGKLATQAARSMRRYPLRTSLMMAGIVAGIASLAALASIGEATKRETMRRFKNMIGTFDTIMVRPGGGRSRGMPTLVNVPPTLRFDDARAIATNLPEIKAVAEMQSAFDIDVKYRDRAASPAVFGVSANWLSLRSDEVEQGAFFSEEQDQSLARVAVIGPELRKSLFPDDDEPLGKTIRIAEVPFQVIGVLHGRGAGPAGGSLDNLALIPVNTASRRLFNRDYVTMLIAQLKDPSRSEDAVAAVTALLRERHHIRPPALDDFAVTNPAAVMARVTQASGTLEKILTGVAVMALMVGGIVIMSLMSIAVSERRSEIGIRRAAGASRGDIVMQFTLEAAFVSLSGGLLGVIIGWGGLEAATRLQKLPPVFVWQPLGVSLLLSLAIGLAFGGYPAWKASRVDPAQALRS